MLFTRLSAFAQEVSLDVFVEYTGHKDFCPLLSTKTALCLFDEPENLGCPALPFMMCRKTLCQNVLRRPPTTVLFREHALYLTQKTLFCCSSFDNQKLNEELASQTGRSNGTSLFFSEMLFMIVKLLVECFPASKTPNWTRFVTDA